MGHATNKDLKKKNPSKNSSTGEGLIVKNICCVLLPAATTSLKMPYHGEDMLCLTASLIVKKIQLYTFSSSAMYFYQCVYQIECLWCQVPSREGLYEWDMLPIKI